MFEQAADIYDDNFVKLYAPYIRTWKKNKLMLEEDPNYTLYVIDSGNMVVVAMALIYEWDDVVLIDYLAVSQNRQCNGVGSFMIRELCKIFEKPLLGEVGHISEMGKRRINWHKKLGYITLAKFYIYPVYMWNPMAFCRLLALIPPEHSRPTPFIIKKWVRRIYIDVYKTSRVSSYIYLWNLKLA